jgi:hypothetical protein
VHESLPDQLPILAAKQAIYDVLCRYCRGVDRGDFDLIRGCYHPGAYDHHVGFDGPIEGFLDYARWRIEGGLGTMHVIANHLIEVEGDVGRAETYVNSWSWDPDQSGAVVLSTTGTRYVDRFERRRGEWRIAERWAVRAFKLFPSGRVDLPDAASGTIGLRSSEDISYSAGCPTGFKGR